MTDRELLESAAKAAGIEHMGWVPAGLTFGHRGPWNPLTDDGDALRLAHALRMNIEPQTTMGGVPVGFNVWPAGRGDCGVTEDVVGLEGMRRAIVRAASAMGKS